MQIIHDFKINFYEYYQNGKHNHYPELKHCPRCHDRMVKHGFYSRYIATISASYKVYIRRYRCKHCGRTVSFLPSFLLPQFQMLLLLIFKAIVQYNERKRFLLDFRLVFFYLKRFGDALNGCIAFFRELTPQIRIPLQRRRAVETILASIKRFPSGVFDFSQRYFQTFGVSFMSQ